MQESKIKLELLTGETEPMSRWHVLLENIIPENDQNILFG
jgi:hypothetical protein